MMKLRQENTMLSLRLAAILLILVGVAFACAPNYSKRHGYCEYYVDGSSDISRKKRDSDSSDSSGGGGGGGGGRRRFNRYKKKKNVGCYKYEDGSKDPGATLKPGVKEYTVTVTEND